MTTPFVQGRLRNEPIEAAIETECACCSRPLHLLVGGDHARVEETGAAPLVFEPQVDWTTFEEPNILHAY